MNAQIVLFIGLVWPEPTSSAAGTRIIQLIKLYTKLQYKIVFASAALENEYSFDLEMLEVEKHTITLNCSSFDDFIKKIIPNIVVFDRFISEEQFGWRVFENCPKAIRILDSEDLHCLRLERQNAIKKGYVFNEEDLINSEIAMREIASILRCNLTLIISKYEFKILEKLFNIPKNNLFYLPLTYSNKFFNLDFSKRKDFIFIGNFWHEPNLDAVLQLKKEIWPVISKQIPDAKLHIYGAYSSKKITDLNNEKERFLVHGRAKNAFEVLENAKILLAPIRFGAGIKGKLLEAMTVGTCSITTKIGCEGIENKKNWNGFVTNTNQEFIEKSIKLYSSKKTWEVKQKKGYLIIDKKFNPTNHEINFKNKIEKIIKNKQSNFVAALLFSKQFNSLKFMSKWIDEKNKNINSNN